MSILNLFFQGGNNISESDLDQNQTFLRLDITII
jgi:hypothetical protein